MVSFTAVVATALTLIRSVVTAPSVVGPVEESFQNLDKRQGSPWQWWTEGRGQFSCQQQGGGKYSCNWNGQSGGGMVAGTGWGAGRK
jgi:endo-1,4-beta-xylanase